MPEKINIFQEKKAGIFPSKKEATLSIPIPVFIFFHYLVPSAPLNVQSFMVAPYDTWTIVNWDRPLQQNGAILSYTVLFTDNMDENDASGMSSLVTTGNSSRISLCVIRMRQLPFSS